MTQLHLHKCYLTVAVIFILSATHLANAKTLTISKNQTLPAGIYDNIVINRSAKLTLKGSVFLTGSLRIKGALDAGIFVVIGKVVIEKQSNATVITANKMGVAGLGGTFPLQAEPFMPAFNGSLVFNGSSLQEIDGQATGGLTSLQGNGNKTLKFNYLLSKTNRLAFEADTKLLLGNFSVTATDSIGWIDGFTAKRYLVTNGTGALVGKNGEDGAARFFPVGTSTAYLPITIYPDYKQFTAKIRAVSNTAPTGFNAKTSVRATWEIICTTGKINGIEPSFSAAQFTVGTGNGGFDVTKCRVSYISNDKTLAAYNGPATQKLGLYNRKAVYGKPLSTGTLALVGVTSQTGEYCANADTLFITGNQTLCAGDYNYIDIAPGAYLTLDGDITFRDGINNYDRGKVNLGIYTAKKMPSASGVEPEFGIYEPGYIISTNPNGFYGPGSNEYSIGGFGTFEYAGNGNQKVDVGINGDGTNIVLSGAGKKTLASNLAFISLENSTLTFATDVQLYVGNNRIYTERGGLKGMGAKRYFVLDGTGYVQSAFGYDGPRAIGEFVTNSLLNIGTPHGYMGVGYSQYESSSNGLQGNGYADFTVTSLLNACPAGTNPAISIAGTWVINASDSTVFDLYFESSSIPAGFDMQHACIAASDGESLLALTDESEVTMVANSLYKISGSFPSNISAGQTRYYGITSKLNSIPLLAAPIAPSLKQAAADKRLSANQHLPIVKIIGNPTSQLLMLQINSVAALQGSANIVDVNGRIVKTSTLSLPAGTSNQQIPLNGVPYGNYILQVKVGNKQIGLKFVRQ